MFLKEDDWVESCAIDALIIADEIGNVFFPPLARLYIAWIRVRRGDHSALPEVIEHFEAWRAGGTGILVSGNYTLLLESYLACGRFEEGLSAGVDAHRHIVESDERHLEGEICRLEGELLAARARSQQSPQEDHARALQKVKNALEIAQAADAQSLGLRAHISNVRLHRGLETYPDAVRGLRTAYDWFTEGFDTHDLKEAKTLLESAQ
jgi:predicted ATPase